MGWCIELPDIRRSVGCCTVTWSCPLVFDTVTMWVVKEKNSLKYSEPKVSLRNVLPKLTVQMWNKLDRGLPNYATILKIYMSWPITSCEVDRRYFWLSIRKKLIFITMLVKRLSDLSNLSAENDLKSPS